METPLLLFMALSFAAGMVIAFAIFAALFSVVAWLLPRILEFASSKWVRLVPVVMLMALLMIMVSLWRGRTIRHPARLVGESTVVCRFHDAIIRAATGTKERWYDLFTVSRKPALIKLINLEEGMPTVNQARLLLERELRIARDQGLHAVKLIHGYGSSGVGGALRHELQKHLRAAARNQIIRAVIAGEDWRISDETTWALLKRFPEWKQDSDLGRGNQGISIVVL